MRRTFDFHLHTTCSDGFRAPADVLLLAEDAGLSGISITDHDTVDAYAELARDGDRSPRAPWVLPGVEISARLGDGEAHIIGYFPGGVSARVGAWVEEILAGRRRRIAEGVRNLRERGLDVSLEDCSREAAGRVVSRTHLAQVLVKKRYVLRHERAYRQLLGKDVVPLPYPAAEDVTRTIADLGGISIWAHPAAQGFREAFEVLAAAGLAGLEAHTPRRKREDGRMMAAAARERGLLVTGGSDWHGWEAGPRLGKFRVAEENVKELLERISRDRKE